MYIDMCCTTGVRMCCTTGMEGQCQFSLVPRQLQHACKFPGPKHAPRYGDKPGVWPFNGPPTREDYKPSHVKAVFALPKVGNYP